MRIITLHNISKSYGTQVLFKDYTLEIEQNSFTTIAGPSGCGKSTLLNMIGLLEPYDKGDLILCGSKNIKPYSSKARSVLKTKIGYLFQNFALLENKSVLYNLSLVTDYKKNKNKMITALQQVGLDESFLKKKVCQCSGGEQQRIAIARLLLKECEVILADEPTGSLDEGNKLQVYELLRTLQDLGKTIVIVTHDEELMNLSDVVIKLNKGIN